MDWCLDLTAEDLDLDGDKVRLKEVKLQKASGTDNDIITKLFLLFLRQCCILF